MRNYTAVEYVKLIYSGSNYFEVLEQLIAESKEVIHLQTYILEMDTTGIRIMDALKKAAARGVEVYVLVDAFGSYPFSSETIKAFTEAGINFRLYAPLFSAENVFFSRRLHHKIVVMDKRIALIGGINIADKYHIGDESDTWLDYAVHIEGSVCEYLHLLCEKIYKKQRSEKKLRDWEGKIAEIKEADHLPLVRFRRNDWIKRKDEVYESYVSALSQAERSVTIVASYFLPGASFRKLLKEAAQRKVDIKIILAGKSDIPTIRLAENYLYEFYFKNKIQLYEWTNSVMHGKAMIVDNKWATVGSYNQNYLSHYISIELNADIIDQGFVNEFTSHLKHIIEHDCIFVKLEHMKKKNNWYNKVKMWLAYNFYKLLFEMIMTGKRYRIKK